MNKRRNITFKPTCFSFGPLTQPPKERLRISADELEALYLADFKGLYHEQCSASLGVSRPTFAKILKGARKKMAEMVLFAKAVELTREKQNFTLAFPTNDRITIHDYFLTAKYFAFAKIVDNAIASISYTANPIYTQLLEEGVTIENDESAKGLAAGRMIPPLLKNAQLLVVRSIGDGIRRNIEGLGLNIELTSKSDIDSVLTDLIE